MAILKGDGLPMKFSEMHWKDRQIAAINRLSKFKRWPASDNNPYFERVYNVIYNDKIKTKARTSNQPLENGINHPRIIRWEKKLRLKIITRSQ